MTDYLQTPSQTIGPFFHHGLIERASDDLDPACVAGRRVRVEGRVLDGAGDPVSDAMVEVWQADGEGRYRHPVDRRGGEVPDGFLGFGRVASGEDGSFHLETVLPGGVAGPGGTRQAPHMNVLVFARGVLMHLHTRVYFEGEAANDRDPVLSSIPPDRRGTLLAAADGVVDGVPRFRFDIVLQGGRETVFFEA